MHEGCKQLDFVKQGGFDSKWIDENCSRMRQDGPFVEAGENDNLIVQRLSADPTAVGIFGYSFLYENGDTLKPVTIAGVAPSEDTIASGAYPVSRPLFLYIRNAHRGVIPGLEEFPEIYVAESTMGLGGLLSERGMVPLPAARREEVRNAVMNGTTFNIN